MHNAAVSIEGIELLAKVAVAMGVVASAVGVVLLLIFGGGDA